MYEARHVPPLPRRRFLARLARHGFAAILLIGCSLALGMIGYRIFESMSWLDAFANAAMILSGMGPLSPLKTDGGKFFAGCYSLFSGVLFITTAAILLAPVAHRILHRFHFEADRKAKND